MTEKPSCSGACCASSAAPVAAPALPSAAGAVRSVFRIPGMDCPAEEQMIRMSLSGAPVAALDFDLAGRRLTVHHQGDPAVILERLLPLGYGAELAETGPAGAAAAASDGAAGEARVLWWLLAINAVMFVVELGAGWWAGSVGLIADALDMFADAAVYGVALYAVGRAAADQRLAARLAGVLEMLLALGALAETGRRMFTGQVPEGTAMMAVSLLALAANVACLLLLARHRHRGVHMRASYIFSANDVIANLGVIAAGALVAWTGRPWPDWLIGTGIGLLVLVGALRILRLSRAPAGLRP